MPEMRKNPVSREWIIVAPERANRPHSHLTTDITGNPHQAHHSDCPFCPGNEHLTPKETLIYKNDHSGWDLRAIANKFPALNKTNSFSINKNNPLEEHAFAEGISEVIIETPHHSKNIAFYSLEEIELLIKAYKERYTGISKEKNIKFVSIFKNNGKKSGASISHAHSQIIGIPVVPPVIEHEISSAAKYYEEKGSCIFCDNIALEIKEKTRIIFENEDFISFLPFASRFPFEIMIVPKFHSSKFQFINDLQIKKLAEIMKAVLYKLYEGLENPPYNYYIHTSPVGKNAGEFYHWHIELIPRNLSPGGFELCTGIYINISSPEANAKILREIEVK